MVCSRVGGFSQSGVMTIHSGVTKDPDPVSSGMGMAKPENPVHASLARIAEEFADNSDSQSPPGDGALVSDINEIVRPQTPAEACLAPTLALFGWAGEGRRIREALPHFDRVENLEGLRLVLTHLGYGTTPRSVRMSDITDEVMPCLFSHDGAAVMLIVERESGWHAIGV